MVDEFIEVAARHGRKIRACISITQQPQLIKNKFWALREVN
jgi:hypothetical protein